MRIIVGRGGVLNVLFAALAWVIDWLFKLVVYALVIACIIVYLIGRVVFVLGRAVIVALKNDRERVNFSKGSKGRNVPKPVMHRVDGGPRDWTPPE